ncbi:hypothetical protein NMT57_10635, partial [Escherichia coli]|nr:hypothetical protein [Escherichia coli]
IIYLIITDTFSSFMIMYSVHANYNTVIHLVDNVYTQLLIAACVPKQQVVKNVFVGVGSNGDVFTPLILFNFTNE